MNLLHGARALAILAMAVTISGWAAADGWLSAKKHDGIAYFLYDAPPSIERYELSTDTWLNSIALADTPTAFEPADGGLFIAYGDTVMRRNLDGSDESLLFDAGAAIQHLAVDGDLVFVQSGPRRVTTVDADSGTELDSLQLSTNIGDLAAAPGLRRLFLHGSSSASRLVYIQYTEAGLLSAPVQWPHTTQELRVNTPLALSPDESLLFDQTGSAFDTATLSFVGSLGNTITALDGFDDGFAVLRNQFLSLYGPDLLIRGSLLLPNPAHAMFVDGNNALVFSRGDGTAAGITVASADLADFPTLELEFFEDTPTLDLSFLRDGIVDENGLAYISIGGSGDIFRLFDTHTQQFVANFRVPVGAYMTRPDIEARRIYTATQEGAVLYLDLDDITQQFPLFNVPYTIIDFIAIDDFIFANTMLGFQNPAFRTYDLEGNPLDARSSNNIISQYHIWEPGRRRVYHLREIFLTADLMYTEVGEDGAIGATVGSGAPADGATFPIRVSPDGERILLGSGRIHAADGLGIVGNLPNPIVDALWLNGVLFTLANVDDSAQVQRWSGEDFDPDGSLDLGDVPLGMTDNGENLVVATRNEEGYKFTIVSPELVIVPPPIPLNPADINGDGVVNALDVQLVINAALGIEIEFDADANGDGQVNAVDVQLVINAALGLGD